MQQPCVGPLVRAISTTSVVIWAEFTQPGIVTLSATLDTDTPSEHLPLLVKTHTISIGGHHYAAPMLQGLAPARWYHYRIGFSDVATSEADQATRIPEPDPVNPLLQCFRTLDEAEVVEGNHLRVFYGSCRRLDQPEKDTFDVLGSWLIEHSEQREQVWPHVLLLIGDQIYADNPPSALIDTHPNMQKGANSFADFAAQYAYAWTNTEQVRQALACVPTYMICDDHEITNGWNSTPAWRAHMLQIGQEQLLVDGLVAYWVYQAWGNLDQRETEHPLLQIMREAEQSGEDVLEALRTCVKQTIYGDIDLRWHYIIPTTPPIFVTCTRVNRSSAAASDADKRYARAQMMSGQQAVELRDWLQAQRTGVSLLVSSVPVLLPPFIGRAEYIMGIRLWTHAVAPLRWLGRQLARLQLNVADRAGFEHWPAYATSWQALVKSVEQQSGDIVVLSGDVHFSYAMEGLPEVALRAHTQLSKLYQLVSTPIQNSLHKNERRLIQGQAFLTRSIYGGLSTRVLPLQVPRADVDTAHDLLFENTIACVTIALRPQQERKYDLQHEYLGRVDGQLLRIGETSFPRT